MRTNDSRKESVLERAQRLVRENDGQIHPLNRLLTKTEISAYYDWCMANLDAGIARIEGQEEVAA